MSAPSTLHDQSILVTGGTGAFGRAFVARCLADGARRVVVFSRDEAKQAAMRATVTDPRVRYFLGDVRDAGRVRWAMRGATIVVHAAAMKRVDSCEADPDEAVDTNIAGTQHVAHGAIREHVERAVFLSTDKAAAPSTLYGMTKATAERLWIQSNAYAAGTTTKLAATRYGNVLGSTGSVVPIWRDEVARHGRITITESAASRFWMPMSDAVDLVILALETMRGGETFVPKLKAATVARLASALAPDAAQRIIGLQSGEKMHETLIGADEAARTVDRGTHYVITPACQTWGRDTTEGEPVGGHFVVRSDTAPSWSVDELRGMAA